MSVLIKGMKMPKEGLSVVVDLWNNGKAYVYGTGNAEMYDAVELPDHGDLVDIDEVMKTASEMDIYWETECELPMILRNAPVLIPAERSEE